MKLLNHTPDQCCECVPEIEKMLATTKQQIADMNANMVSALWHCERMDEAVKEAHATDRAVIRSLVEALKRLHIRKGPSDQPLPCACEYDTLITHAEEALQ